MWNLYSGRRSQWLWFATRRGNRKKKPTSLLRSAMRPFFWQSLFSTIKLPMSQPPLRCCIQSQLRHMGPYSLHMNNDCAVCSDTVSDPDHVGSLQTWDLRKLRCIKTTSLLFGDGRNMKTKSRRDASCVRSQRCSITMCLHWVDDDMTHSYSQITCCLLISLAGWPSAAARNLCSV